jgi:hypothetical protein
VLLSAHSTLLYIFLFNQSRIDTKLKFSCVCLRPPLLISTFKMTSIVQSVTVHGGIHSDAERRHAEADALRRVPL